MTGALVTSHRRHLATQMLHWMFSTTAAGERPEAAV